MSIDKVLTGCRRVKGVTIAKSISYQCDVCHKPCELEDLEAVQLYIFQSCLTDPNVLDYEQVCLECRDELVKLVNKWSEVKGSK